jgi:plasmid stabilization system protein ParE
MKVVFLTPAREELEAAAEFYEEQAEGLGIDFLAEVEHALDGLCGTPEMGPHFVDDTRRLLLSRFPYQLIYLIDRALIVIIAVAHVRRKPGYWRNRI